MFCFFFFFKQKTAYEMRISDWSSDVCSSDLAVADQVQAVGRQFLHADRAGRIAVARIGLPVQVLAAVIVSEKRGVQDGDRHGYERASEVSIGTDGRAQIGRASCRERVCLYV